MVSGKKSVLDALVCGSDSDSESASDGEAKADPSTSAAAGGVVAADGDNDDDEDGEPGCKKPKKGSITLDDLERAGYKSGPSVLLMKPPEEQGQTNWAWSSGKEAKEREPEQESWQERQATRHAATVGTDQTAILARKALEQAQKLHEERRLEREQARAEARGLSFNQKEKRKREQGKVSRVGSYVEEEKRKAREHGVFSGFD